MWAEKLVMYELVCAVKLCLEGGGGGGVRGKERRIGGGKGGGGVCLWVYVCVYICGDD